MKRSLLTLMLIPLMSSAAMAQTLHVNVVGAGQESCGAWTQAEPNTLEYNEQQEWLWGFVTSYNTYVAVSNGNVARGGDGYGMTAWVGNYCRAHPLDSVEIAAAKLIAELHSRSGTSQP